MCNLGLPGRPATRTGARGHERPEQRSKDGGAIDLLHTVQNLRSGALSASKDQELWRHSFE
ncbi:hypothetical protein GCM10010358_83640 [Streptomyces minutiscleroticus]|uniref:Uncharacterized protein n=1 Tax=Streptomyces minutiscleroticus TaxID=68238 RepID=A0A918P5Z2_9ACTN|nr:hypothetical protein GCM10010358_83640 [Streptomyces minutiscleroticus]